MSNKSIIFLIAIILSCSCIFASNEWNEIERTGGDDVDFDILNSFSDTLNLNHYFFNSEKNILFINLKQIKILQH